MFGRIWLCMLAQFLLAKCLLNGSYCVCLVVTMQGLKFEQYGWTVHGKMSSKQILLLLLSLQSMFMFLSLNCGAIWRYKQIDRQEDRQIDRQTDRQTDRQIDIHTNIKDQVLYRVASQIKMTSKYAYGYFVNYCRLFYI